MVLGPPAVLALKESPYILKTFGHDIRPDWLL